MKTASLSVRSLLLAGVLILGVGCAKKLDDGKMSSEIQGKFSQDSGLASKQLTVQANNGVVTLSGTVDNAAQRDAAGRQAASIEGVKTVVNNLQVGDAAAMNPPASQPVADAKPAPVPMAAEPEPSKPDNVSAKKEAKSRKHDSSRASRKLWTSDSRPDRGVPPIATDDPPPAGSTDMQSAQPAITAVDTPPPPPPPPAPKKFIIDQGTQMTVRLIDPIDSEKNQTGETFRATLNAPLTSDGEEAVPSGVELTGHLVSVKSAGKFAGQSEVVMQLDSLSSGGRTYNVQTDQYRKTGSSRGKNTAEKVGGGAIIGGIIGAIAGGGKGAAIGSAAGAGVGGGVQAATKSQQIKLPSETILNFTLQAPVTVVQAQPVDSNRPKLPDSQ